MNQTITNSFRMKKSIARLRNTNTSTGERKSIIDRLLRATEKTLSDIPKEHPAVSFLSAKYICPLGARCIGYKKNSDIMADAIVSAIVDPKIVKDARFFASTINETTQDALSSLLVKRFQGHIILEKREISEFVIFRFTGI